VTDIRLNSDGDIWWENGLIDTVTGNEEILQRLQLALETGLGEWSFDTSVGIPYRASTESRAGNEALLEGAIRATCERILGVDSVRALELVRDPSLRHLTVNVDTVYGRVTVTR